MRIVVTGASGFLGSHVLRALLDSKDSKHQPIAGIRAAHRQTIIEQRLGNDAVTFAQLDLSKPSELYNNLAQVGPIDCIIHCAAYGVDFRQQDMNQAIDINIKASVALLEAAARLAVPRFVHIGTAYEYGAYDELISEDFPLRPVGLYGGTKAAASIVLQERAAALEVPLVVLRPFSMFGRWEESHKLVPQVVAAALTGSPLDMTEGLEIRDYLPVEEVAKGIFWCASLPSERFPAGQSFNICSGKGIRIRDLALRVAQALGPTDVLRFGALPTRPTKLPQVVGNPARWHALTEQGHSSTTFDDCLQEMAKHARRGAKDS